MQSLVDAEAVVPASKSTVETANARAALEQVCKNMSEMGDL